MTTRTAGRLATTTPSGSRRRRAVRAAIGAAVMVVAVAGVVATGVLAKTTGELTPAPDGPHRAACHQQTGVDDESVEPLATCLAAIPSDAPRP